MDSRRPQQFFSDVHRPIALDFLRQIPIGQGSSSTQQFVFPWLAFEALGEVPGPGKSVSLYVADSNRLSEPNERRRVLVGTVNCDVRAAGRFPGGPLYLRAPYLVLEIQSAGFTVFNFEILSGMVIALDQDADPSIYL